MNWLDIVIIIILAIALFDSWRHGLVHFIFDFMGMIAGVFAARLLYLPLASKLDFIQSKGLAEIVAFLIICIIVGLAAAMLGHRILEPRIKRLIPSQANRIGGMVLGFVSGVAVSIVIVLMLNKFVALSPGIPGEATSGIRHTITTVLSESFFAGYIIEWFGTLI